MHLYHNMWLTTIFYMIICMIYVHILHIIYVKREVVRYKQAGGIWKGGGRGRWRKRQEKERELTIPSSTGGGHACCTPAPLPATKMLWFCFQHKSFCIHQSTCYFILSVCYGVKVISMAASSLLHHKALSMLSGPWMAPQKWAPHMYQPIKCSTGECKWKPSWSFHQWNGQQIVILYLHYRPQIKHTV